MKTIVRAFVAVLVLTGAVATTQTSSASTQNKVNVARTSMLPIPFAHPTIPMPVAWHKAAKRPQSCQGQLRICPVYLVFTTIYGTRKSPRSLFP